MLRAEIDDGADVELAAGEDGQGDLIGNVEVAFLDGERPRRALRDRAPAQAKRLISAESQVLRDQVDFVTAGRSGLLARELGDLGRRDQASGQRDAHRGIGRDRRGRTDDGALVECDLVGLPIRDERQLTAQATQSERRERAAPRAIEHGAPCELCH